MCVYFFGVWENHFRDDAFVQYILGQLNSPIDQMITFIHSAQDAKISLERLGEIDNKADEVNLDAEKNIPYCKYGGCTEDPNKLLY